MAENDDFKDEGMAERLSKLRERLLPDTMPQALLEAQFASPLRDKKDEKMKKSQWIRVLTAALNRINYNKAGADIIINNYIENTMLDVITNDEYFLNLVQLLQEAFEFLADGGGFKNGNRGEKAIEAIG